MIREITYEEVRENVFSMGMIKHQGPMGCLTDLVDNFQNAFIPGRRISDNILLTQELLKNYHRPVGAPRYAIKVDIKKAYDSVSWEFLIDALRLFRFPDKFIGWVCECISMPTYSVILNGQMFGFFKGEKGIRQGDPLSPYLFTLVMQMSR
ncbi:secreted RxLR effector protein 78-like [Apium graveolens]|uniref:secreted RxLR effector protein 78-like n=1 Tax=Apium graveolens TaxID=4045 RepID=UPI003D7B1EC1